jgi:hypothetical protein
VYHRKLAHAYLHCKLVNAIKGLDTSYTSTIGLYKSAINLNATSKEYAEENLRDQVRSKKGGMSQVKITTVGSVRDLECRLLMIVTP